MINNPSRLGNPQNWGDPNVVIDGDFPTAPIVMVPATTELPIWAGLPPVTRVRYERRSLRRRIARSQFAADVRDKGVVIGLCLPAPIALAYAIAQILGAQ